MPLWRSLPNPKHSRYFLHWNNISLSSNHIRVDSPAFWLEIRLCIARDVQTNHWDYICDLDCRDFSIHAPLPVQKKEQDQ